MGASPSCSLCCFSKKSLDKPKESDAMLNFAPPRMPDSLSDSTGDGEAQQSDTILHMCERDMFLSTIAETTDRFLKLINEPVDATFELTVDKDGCRVFTKESTNGCIVRAEWTVPFSPKTYMDFLGDTGKRKQWDTNIEEVKIVELLDKHVTLSYLRYKKILTLSQRDLVLVSKKFELGSGFVDAFCSVDASACPLVPGFVRANVYTGGYFLEDLSQGSNVPLTKVVSYSEGSCGIPKGLLRRISAANVPKLVKQMDAVLRTEEESNGGS